MSNINTIIEKLEYKGYSTYYIFMFLHKYNLNEIYIRNPFRHTWVYGEDMDDIGFTLFKEEQLKNIELALTEINYLNYV